MPVHLFLPAKIPPPFAPTEQPCITPQKPGGMKCPPAASQSCLAEPCALRDIDDLVFCFGVTTPHTLPPSKLPQQPLSPSAHNPARQSPDIHSPPKKSPEVTTLQSSSRDPNARQCTAP